jgi:hypothetical protein
MKDIVKELIKVAYDHQEVRNEILDVIQEIQGSEGTEKVAFRIPKHFNDEHHENRHYMPHGVSSGRHQGGGRRNKKKQNPWQTVHGNWRAIRTLANGRKSTKTFAEGGQMQAMAWAHPDKINYNEEAGDHEHAHAYDYKLVDEEGNKITEEQREQRNHDNGNLGRGEKFENRTNINIKGGQKVYNCKVTGLANFHDFEEEDVDEVLHYRETRPSTGRKLSKEDQKKHYIEWLQKNGDPTSKADTIAKVREMSPDDFTIMLKSIMDEDEEHTDESLSRTDKNALKKPYKDAESAANAESAPAEAAPAESGGGADKPSGGGSGKPKPTGLFSFASSTSLRSQIIRLAFERPELRPDLIAALKEAGGCENLPEGKMRDMCESKSKGSDEEGENEESGKEAALRQKAIRLAFDKPALRSALLSLLK